MESAPFGSNLTLDEQLSSSIMIKLVPEQDSSSPETVRHWSGSGGTTVYSGTAAFGLTSENTPGSPVLKEDWLSGIMKKHE